MQSWMISVHRHKDLYHIVIHFVSNLKHIFHSFTVSKSLLASVKMNCSGICMGIHVEPSCSLLSVKMLSNFG